MQLYGSAVMPGALPAERRCALVAAHPTSPLFIVRCSVGSVSGHGGVPPCPRVTRLSRGMRGSCSTRPLRPPASLLHNAALPSVPASRCAKAPLGAGHRFAPCRVKATGVMQSGLRWSRAHSRLRFPVVGTPYAPPSARPCGLSWHRGIGQALRALFWSVACGQSCGVCPRPPLCFAAARHQPCALVCPSAPRGGSLSPRAMVVGFCYKLCSCLRTEYGGYRPNGL